MQHHAPLDQINRDTVARLGLAWSAEMPTSFGLVGNPLIQHGTVFQGGPGGQIFASDIRTGQLKWHFAATSAVPARVDSHLDCRCILSLIVARHSRTKAIS